MRRTFLSHRSGASGSTVRFLGPSRSRTSRAAVPAIHFCVAGASGGNAPPPVCLVAPSVPTSQRSLMDVSRLDGLTGRLRLGHSRRGLTRLFGAVVFTGPLSLMGRSETAAKKRCPPCKKRKQGTCKGKKPDGTACAGGTCQRGSASRHRCSVHHHRLCRFNVQPDTRCAPGSAARRTRPAWPGVANARRPVVRSAASMGRSA